VLVRGGCLGGGSGWGEKGGGGGPRGGGVFLSTFGVVELSWEPVYENKAEIPKIYLKNQKNLLQNGKQIMPALFSIEKPSLYPQSNPTGKRMV